MQLFEFFIKSSSRYIGKTFKYIFIYKLLFLIALVKIFKNCSSLDFSVITIGFFIAFVRGLLLITAFATKLPLLN